ncbi:bifunctional phosphoribosylaminoimidazolecarboxamide formyltransferase/IMP cyclohydrolase [candidate division CSSED10-310 bacterium]|uniref:Bifunctional purine biosynthesis protein PurH n=1 Tax=candidate division CSSED10-310 bacterium TaxID=2855610 RepID=A0ABV6YZF6_UNCC1
MGTEKGKRRIKRALVSLYHKEAGLSFCRYLQELNVEIIASGGTAKFLTEQGIKVIRVADITRFHDILGGRVKTLHPSIFGGILARRDKEQDLQELQNLGLITLDLIYVNLYPFKQAVAEAQPLAEAVELIDIGGSALIRAAAKNYHDVTVIVDQADIAQVDQEMRASGGYTYTDTRLALAVKAFQASAAYDQRIAAYLSSFLKHKKESDTAPYFPEKMSLELTDMSPLKYGENPHQEAAFYRVAGADNTFATFENVAQRPLSFNNLFDLHAAYELVWDFAEPTIAIIKHATPCGIASHDDLATAYQNALDCDPLSAYGSIIALNRKVDLAVAQKIHGTKFIEAVVAPDYDPDALKKLKKKKKRRFISCKPPQRGTAENLSYRWIGGGFLLQVDDKMTYKDDLLSVVSARKPTAPEMADLLFAWTAVKHVRSNAILLAKDKSSVGIGGGQTSRVDSCQIALDKAGPRTQNSVMASDAFFPFRDSIDLIKEKGVTAVIQPGGSIRDEEVITACNEHDIAMVFTGIRHFRHQ